MKCEYGCGREAKYPPRKGNPKWTCEYNYQNCPNKYHRRSDEDVKLFLESKGYKWISGEYKNVYSSLVLKCKNGHEYSTNYNNITTGGSCPECNNFIYWNIDKVKQYSKERGYTCLSKIFKTTEYKIKLQCIFGHIFNMRWDIFTSGADCPECKHIQHSVCMSGSSNPNWKGGIQSLPYCELWGSLDFKESIKFRDGYKCLNPCCNKNSETIVIHHIDYDKLNCNRNNLITLCNSCNVIANYNREWHKSWYKAILYHRYNYN